MENKIEESVINEWLVETLPYEVIWIDEDAKVVYANTKFCNKLGYKKSEVMGLYIYDINPTTTEISWKEHWQSITKEKRIRNKTNHKSKSGYLYDVEVLFKFFSNNGKNLICAIINDVSHSSFYKDLSDHAELISKVGGWKLNLKDGSLLVTKETLKIFGTEKKDDLILGNIINFFLNPDELKDHINSTIRKAHFFDTILETNETPSRYIKVAGNPILKNDKVIKVLIVFQDVTVQKERENKLAFFKSIIDNTKDLVYIYDHSGKLLHYSLSVVESLGFTNNELDRFSIFDLDSNITKDWWVSHFNELKSHGALRMEWLVTRKDGTKFPADITANHLRYNNEDLNCAVVRDITEKKANDLNLYEALEEIKELKMHLENENEYLQAEIRSKINYKNTKSKSESYENILKQVALVAPTDTTVLITGESGTGKELLASAIHSNSMRKGRPLIKINCATLPKELIESELFGHKKGSFTGATENKLGKFSLADGGTILLDEIGEMPIDLQSKLLRVLQEGEFDELGGSRTTKVDVRVVASTNRDLVAMIKEGTFRQDLYYRLNVFPIHNIPLRARKEDIPLLAHFFLEKCSVKAGKVFKRLSKKTIDQLMKYNFPGNIRELKNLIERAVIVENGTTLNPGTWMPKVDHLAATNEFISFEALQREYIIEVLNHTNWRVSGVKGAATILNMKDKTLFAKMKRLGIEKQISLKE